MFAAKAGATYVSLFAGRINDEGGNAAEVIANSVAWLDDWDFKSELIVAVSAPRVMSSARRWRVRTSLPCRRSTWINRDHKYSRVTVKELSLTPKAP